MSTRKTRGIRALEEIGAAFEVVEYVFRRKGAKRTAGAVGWDEAQVIKSLVVEVGEKEYCFALIPANRDLSLKRLARVMDTKQVQMAHTPDAERLTGYVAGGISPFGSYAELSTVIDESLLDHDQVLINAGHRGVLVSMSPWDIAEVLEAQIESVATG